MTTLYQNIWYPTHEKLANRRDIKGENAASIKNVINKSINLSKRLDNQVVWLLQYPSYPTANDLELRQMLRQELSTQNINFIVAKIVEMNRNPSQFAAIRCNSLQSVMCCL